MRVFFELLEKRVGFSRSGRIILSKEKKKIIKTPNIIIPLNHILMQQFNFFKEFEDQDIFLISKDKYIRRDFVHDKFKRTCFVYSPKGTVEQFQRVLSTKLNHFSQDDIIPIIPFNIPFTTISKEFAAKEIENYLKSADKILTNNPDLNFGFSVKIFDYFELIDLYIPLIQKHKNLKIINLIDIFDNLNNYRNILRTIVKIKSELDNNLVLMVSGKVKPKFYPMLIYLGIDLIDCSYLLYLSSEYFYDTIEHLIPIYKIKYFPCSCIVCRDNLKNLIGDKYSPEKITLLCLHNLISAKNYMNKIKQYLHFEDFRAFVEKSSLDDMNLISMLRVLDKNYFGQIKYETPIIQQCKTVNCLGPSSYYRPDFQEFRERTVKNFTPEPSTKLIILLPCSARKPYSDSKSHQQFFKAIRKFPDSPMFQEIILTSPLGAIPRQLENVYLVNSYDISVTGEWDTEEISISAEMLVKILEKYDKSIPIICHLEGDYLKIVKKAQEKIPHEIFFSEIHGRITSKESLNSLEELIRNYKNKFSSITKFDYFTKTWERKFVKLLDYQFGLGSGVNVLSNGAIPIRNKNNTQINLIDPKTKELLGVFKYSSGQIALTINGAKRLKPFSNLNVIIFNGNKISGNTLFRPGIIEYDLKLIPSDFIIILDEEKQNIIGLGQLIVGSNYIKNSKSGRIAKIYERI